MRQSAPQIFGLRMNACGFMTATRMKLTGHIKNVIGVYYRLEFPAWNMRRIDNCQLFADGSSEVPVKFILIVVSRSLKWTFRILTTPP